MIALRIVVAVVGVSIGASLLNGSAASLNQTSQNLTPYRTCTITATPSSTTAVRDAEVRSASPNSNAGTGTTLDITSGLLGNTRVYVRFDASLCAPAIPPTASIRLATLRLYVSGLASDCRTIAVFRAPSSWSEAGLTWNNQPFGTGTNDPALGTATAQFGVGNPVGCTNRVPGYVTGAVVTADVAAFIAGTAANNGWMLRDSSEGSLLARTNTFSAKNAGTATQAPQLVITYVSVP